MGAIGGMLGMAGGQGGTGIQGPQQANISNPVEAGQIKQSYEGVQNSLRGQDALLNALQGQQGLQNQSNVYNQMQGVANGTGPNPAQAMLAQQTGQNVANQAAMMAGQRGAGQNVGMMARQAAQQGGNLQQQAAGQGATMQANQSLNAIGQMGNMANQMAGQQINQTNQNTAANQAQNQALMNAQQGVNSANVSSQNSVNQANAGAVQGIQANQGKVAGGIMSGIGSAIGLAGGGPVQPAPAMPIIPQGPQSAFAKMLANGGSVMMAQGGAVPALVSPGEKYLPPQAVEQVKQGAKPMDVGQTVPGKAKVKGAKNSYANDTIPATLEEGGIVLPRSVTQSKNPQWAAHKFVSAILAKQGKGMK